MLKFRPMNHRWLPFSVLLFICLAAAQTAPSIVEITADPAHHLAFENDYVRVFKVEIAPHAATLLHHHRHDYISVALGLSQLQNDVFGKPPVKLTLQDGETRFIPGGFAHIAKNLYDQPFRNINVELLQDEKARLSPPPKWDEERGLHILSGGTRDILFVKDGVRAAEIELQPGGVVPKHHHAGPHVVVALTDIDLRSDVEGKGPLQVQLKAGDVAWVNAGETHTLTNIGRQNAKLITLEFQ